MSNLISYRAAFILPIVILLFACTKPLASRIEPGEYEITRLRRTQVNQQPIVFGFLDERQADGRPYPVEVAQRITNFATITINSVSAGSEPTGYYARPLAPGMHRIRLSFPGLQTIDVSPINLKLGDSVRIDFHPRADSARSRN